MPIISFADLIENEKLRKVSADLAALPPGLVLATGQAGSGKVTTLLALVQVVADSGQSATLLTERSTEYDVFHPLPAGWRVVVVEPAKEAWKQSLQSYSQTNTVLVVSPLSRANAAAAVSAARDCWVLAALDTPLIGVDAAYALQEMGVSYESFADQARCVWSQLLVTTLCPECAAPAALSAEELDDLFPAGQSFRSLKTEVGCAACGWRGTEDHRDAVCDVSLIDASTRLSVRKALFDGTPLHLSPERHVTAQDLARDLLDQCVIGVGVYRDTIRRNPLLRAQNTIEHEQAHSTKLGGLFDKFVSPEVKQRLLSGRNLDAVVKGEAREVTCLFCDIRGFTARAETRDPEVLFKELNRYFAEVVDSVMACQGTIDKFIGDAVMVVFGAPLAQPDHAHLALECALAIHERIEAFNKSNGAELPIVIGMGINSGRTMAGCIGTERRMEYTVLGDAVNIAARLEARASPKQILVSDATRRLAKGKFRFQSIGTLDLKGKSVQVEAFELLGRA